MIINREVDAIDLELWLKIDRSIDKGGYDAWGVILDTEAGKLTLRDMRTGVLFNAHVTYDDEYLTWVIGRLCDDGSEEILDKAIEEYCNRDHNERVKLESLLGDIEIDLWGDLL